MAAGRGGAGALGLVDPYWAFAWAGGQALARHVIDHPALVAGRRVLDFATGSGISAIAAARAGATHVAAVDIDPLAIAALRLNAAANGVAVDGICADLIGRKFAARRSGGFSPAETVASARQKRRLQPG